MSLFGNQPQNSTGGGLFGQNSSTGGAFGGGNPGGGGLFGANSSQGVSAFGGFQKANSQPNQQTPGFGVSSGPGFGQGAQGGGLFGGQSQTQGMGGQNQMGFGNNSSSGGLFGNQNKTNLGINSQPSFGGGGFGSIANASTQGFGQTTQGMGMTSSGFNQSTSAFGGQQTQGLGGVSQFNAGKSSFFNQANAQNSSPGFGQQSTGFGSFGAQPQQQNQPGGNFGQPQSTQGGLFGSQTSSTGFSGAGSFSSSFNNQNPGQQGTPPYSRQPDQFLTSINYNYNPVTEQPAPGGNQKSDQTIKILSLRGDGKYSQCSHEMLKVLDMFAMKNQQVQNYEHKAMQDFNQNSQQYQLLQQMQMLKNQSKPGQTAPTTGAFQSNSFSQGLQQQPQQFGANPQGAGLFGKPQGQGLLGAGMVQPQQNLGQGGGLFGQQDQNKSTGLFGSQQTNPQNSGSSLFGQSTPGGQQQSAAGGGLFGTANSSFNQPASTGAPGGTGGGGLFGAPQSNTQSSLFNKPSAFGQPQTGGTGQGLFGASQPAQQTSLFGSSQPAASNPAGGGLFGGAKPAQPAAGGGLFGASTPTQPAAGAGGGLFGAAQPQGQGLFGQPAKPAGGGLFGAPAQPAQPATGLFGSTPQPQAPGLFGAQAAPQPQATPGLFGQQPQGFNQQLTPGQAPEGPTPGAINLEAFYRFNDPFGLEDSTQKEANQKAVQDEYKCFIDNLKMANNPWDDAYDVLEKNEPLETDHGYTPGEETLGRIRSTCIDEQNRQYEKYQAKYGAGSLYEQQRNDIYRELKQSSKGYKDLRALSRMQSANCSVYAYPSMNDSIPDDLLYPKRSTDTMSSKKPDLSKRWQEVQEGSYMDQTTTPGSETKPAIDGCITVTVVFIYEESDPNNKDAPTSFPEQSYQMLINKSRDVSDVWACTKGWLQQEFNYNESRGQTMQLFLEGKQISQDLSLEDAGLTTDTKIYVKVEHDDELAQKERKAREKAEQESISEQNESKKAESEAAIQKIQLAPKERLPKAPKRGYKISPEMIDLQRMTLEQLQKVKDFQIENEFGSIQFLEEVDLADVDLADIVTIDEKGAEVYDDERHHDKPEVGKKLNVKSLITLNNIRPRQNQTAYEKERKLKHALEKKEGAHHIRYDDERFVWQFRVDHYTRWGDDSEEDEEMDKETHSVEEAKNIDAPIVTSMINDQVLKDIAPPFESITNRIEESLSQDNQSMNAASESQGYDEKKRLLEEDTQKSQQDSMIIDMKNNPIFGDQHEMAKNAIKASHESQQQYAARIRARILQKDREFKECNPLDKMGIKDKPTNQETLDFLKTLAPKPKVAKTSLFQTPRPCFHPNGGILFTSGSKVSVIPVKPIDQVEKSYQPSQVLSKPAHVSIDQKLGQQLENLNLSDQQMDHEAVKLHHKDGGVFDTPMPTAHLIQSNREATTKGLTSFLYDLAEELVGELRAKSDSEYRKKLSHEFLLICMFGAVFANPNIPLVQLHPDYVGPKTLQRMLARYGELDTFLTQKLVLEKQRRNAVTEVLKLHNSLEFKPAECPAPNSNSATDDKIYQRAQDLLLNGQIRDAIRHLNSHKKTRLSLLLSQSVNSGMPKQMLQHQVQTIYKTGQMNPKLKEILLMVTENQLNDPQMPWQKELMRILLFTANPELDLKTIVDNIVRIPSFDNCQDLMWSCLKLYCRIPNAEQDLERWKQNITAHHGNTIHSSRDYRLKWVAQQVVSQWIAIERPRTDIIYAMNEDYMVGTSCQYISQLLFEKDWKTALQVALLMPDSKQHHQVIKAKTVFRILCMQAPELVLKPQADIDFIVQKLKLPEKWFATSLALCYQNFQLNEKAMDEWVKADDLNSAHNIFYSRILPLYMNKSISVSFEKALLQNSDETIMQATKEAWMDNNAVCSGSQDLIQWIEKANLQNSQIDLFSQRTGLFLEFIWLIEHLKSKIHEDEHLTIFCLEKVKLMQQALGATKGELSDVIHRFIIQELNLIATGLILFLQRVNPIRAQDYDQQCLDGDKRLVQQNRALHFRNAQQIVPGHVISQVSAGQQAC